MCSGSNALTSLIPEREGVGPETVPDDEKRHDSEHRRSIDLVRYRLFGKDLLGLETVASVGGGVPAARRVRRQTLARAADDVQGALLAELVSVPKRSGSRRCL